MIVDGGLGLELARRGCDVSSGLWSAQALLTQPEIVGAIHRDYLAAGANVIETATYQLSHDALRERGYDEFAIDAVFARGVALAREAIAAHRAATASAAPAFVAASLGPFGATLGEGGEYSGTQHLERAALYAFHIERLESVARAKPDIFLFETIPTRTEAIVVADVARDLGLERVWISLSCSEGARTYGGDRVADIAAALEMVGCVEVIGVNCTAPSAILPVVHALRSASAKPIVVCPNLGQHWANDAHELVGGAPPAEFLRYVPDWLAHGATHIGGCCGVGPETIRSIAHLVAHDPGGPASKRRGCES